MLNSLRQMGHCNGSFAGFGVPWSIPAFEWAILMWIVIQPNLRCQFRDDDVGRCAFGVLIGKSGLTAELSVRWQIEVGQLKRGMESSSTVKDVLRRNQTGIYMMRISGGALAHHKIFNLLIPIFFIIHPIFDTTAVNRPEKGRARLSKCLLTLSQEPPGVSAWVSEHWGLHHRLVKDLEY